MVVELNHLQQAQSPLGESNQENMSFEELSISMRRMGLTGNDTVENLIFPANMKFKSLHDLDAISPCFRENFERAMALAILSETRRSMKRIKDAYKE